MHLRIVCAANLDTSTGKIVLGVRHYCPRMRDLLPEDWNASTCIQGFVDNRGNFHNRQEAWKIAEAAGQIFRRCGGDDYNGGTLYSENLY